MSIISSVFKHHTVQDFETPTAHPDFVVERESRIQSFAQDEDFKALSNKWRSLALERKYMNNFSWLGRPLIQFPGDVMAIQELISTVKPSLVIETGIAHGGSLILSASMLKLNDIDGRVLGIDVDIRHHNRQAIESSSFAKYISLIECSSVSDSVIKQVKDFILPNDRVIVFLDSNHTHDHVLKELRLYSPFVSLDSYIVVFDTHVEDMPSDYIWKDRPWGKGNNPKTAVHEWLKTANGFQIDSRIENKILLTSAPDGFLRKVSS